MSGRSRAARPATWLISAAIASLSLVIAVVLLALLGAWALLLCPAVAAAAASFRTQRVAPATSVRARWAAVVGAFLPAYYVLTMPLIEKTGSLLRWPGMSLRWYEMYSRPFFHYLYPRDPSWRSFHYWMEYLGLAANSAISWTLTVALPMVLTIILAWLLHRRFLKLSTDAIGESSITPGR